MSRLDFMIAVGIAAMASFLFVALPGNASVLKSPAKPATKVVQPESAQPQLDKAIRVVLPSPYGR